MRIKSLLLWVLTLASLMAFGAAQTTSPGIGKPWPFGLITVTTAGTPVRITSLIGVTNTPECAQLWVSNTSATATIFLMSGNVAKDSTYSQVLMQVAPSTTFFYTPNGNGNPTIPAANLYLDASASASAALVTCQQGVQ